MHPVKSTAIRSVLRADVGPAGLRGDRTWMVVDEAAAMVSARELPELFRVVSDTSSTDPALRSALRLRAPGMPDLELDEPAGPDVEVTMFARPPMRAREAGAEAGEWLSCATGRRGLRLVWCDDPTRRRLNPMFAADADHTAFADGYPVTLATTESLSRLNDQVTGTALERGEEPSPPLPMARFRPNIVISGSPAPYAEDDWTRVAIGAVAFRVVKDVDRCVMTTIDPDTLSRGHEPIRTLARHRRWEGKTWFCRHLVPDGVGTVAVGDELRVLG